MELTGAGLAMSTPDSNGASALHMAGACGRNATVKAFLNATKKINLCTATGASVLSVAARYGRHDTMRLLFRRKADLELADCKGWTALHAACDAGQVESVSLLVKEGARVVSRSTDSIAETPMHRACRNG